MNELQTTNKEISDTLPKEIREKLKEVGLDINVGDRLFSKYDGVIKIKAITEEGLISDKVDSFGKPYENIIRFESLKEYGYNYYKMEGAYEDYKKELGDFVLNREEWIKKQMNSLSTTDVSDTSALIVSGGVNDIIVSRDLTKRLTDKMSILTFMLEKQYDKLRDMRSELMEKLSVIQKVITTLEIYMGIDEDIVQFKEGMKADINEPISFRQRLLFMDEEVGIVNDYQKRIMNGMDISNINVFEEWLIEDNNFLRLIPEEKGVVVLRVRRDKKDYQTRNPFHEAILNEGNFKTFVLIRNGENLYRIWTEKFSIHTRLFPKMDEFENIEKDGTYWEKDELENVKLNYKFNILMMQGLIDRTEIFKPLPDMNVNLFNPNTYGKSINLIFDDENLISSGKPSFKEYLKDINSTIDRGSRIFLALEDKWDRKNWKDYFRKYYTDYSVPALPSDGIYTVEEHISLNEFHQSSYYGDNKGYVIKYNPSDTIYNKWNYYDEGHLRKNNIAIFISKNDRLFNYDRIDLNEVEYYLDDRNERQDYLYMFPILKQMKEERIKELEWEKEFVRLVKDRNNCSEELVWECVEWWKTKNIWKRPIRQDDAKALRMIESRIKKINTK